MTTIGDIAPYNPGRLSEDDFLAGFVARTEEFDYLFRQLQGIGPDDVAAHRLIVAQRGMGKTTLLRRLAIAIERDPVLTQRLVPLTFREEQYDVRLLAMLWRNCSEALAEWLELHGRVANAREIDLRLAATRTTDPDESFAQFAAFCSMQNRRPVLFLDNIDLILAALSDAESWKLRNVLQNSRRTRGHRGERDIP